MQVGNYHVGFMAGEGDRVTFLYRLVPGSANRRCPAPLRTAGCSRPAGRLLHATRRAVRRPASRAATRVVARPRSAGPRCACGPALRVATVAPCLEPARSRPHWRWAVLCSGFRAAPEWVLLRRRQLRAQRGGHGGPAQGRRGSGPRAGSCCIFLCFWR